MKLILLAVPKESSAKQKRDTYDQICAFENWAKTHPKDLYSYYYFLAHGGSLTRVNEPAVGKESIADRVVKKWKKMGAAN